jgi:REP element-mobilizing transposase RayT
MVTRRCLGRVFLLTPGRSLNAVIAFLLALACQRYGVLLHAACFMGNHLHLVLTDAQGELPEFCRWFFQHLAKCVNLLRNRSEAVFTPGSYSRVTLLDETAVLDKIAYTLCNPVAAALVPYGREWPGVRLDPTRMKKPRQVKRPKVFFIEEGKVPGQATLGLSRPQAFISLTEEAYRARVSEVVRAHEEEARQKVLKAGRRFRGAAAVLAQNPLSSPWTREQRRKLKPTVASHDKWHREEAAARDREWQAAYRAAMAAFKAGKTDVEFPKGTYWMVRYAGAHLPKAAP